MNIKKKKFFAVDYTTIKRNSVKLLNGNWKKRFFKDCYYKLRSDVIFHREYNKENYFEVCEMLFQTQRINDDRVFVLIESILDNILRNFNHDNVDIRGLWMKELYVLISMLLRELVQTITNYLNREIVDLDTYFPGIENLNNRRVAYVNRFNETLDQYNDLDKELELMKDFIEMARDLYALLIKL